MNPRLKFTAWVACAVLALSTAHAQFSIDAVVTENAGVFSYSYTFNNSTTDDVLIVNLDGFAPVPTAVQSLIVPSGFTGNFDSSNGVLSFLEGTNFFAANTSVSGFTFMSSFAPSAGTFDAATSLGSSLVGSATVAAIPEPSSAALLGGALMGLFALGQRRRRA